MECRRKNLAESLEFYFKTKKALIDINKEKETYFNYLKPLQSVSLKKSLEGDCMIILPTGYGKSLIFQLLPLICNSKIIIVSPLSAIIQEQVQKFGQHALKIDGKIISPLGNKESQSANENVSRFISGAATYLFSHPEHIINKHACSVSGEVCRTSSLTRHIVLFNGATTFAQTFNSLQNSDLYFPQPFLLL